MKTQAENTPKRKTIKPVEVIELETRFGSHLNGECWGKCFPGKTMPVGDYEPCHQHGGTLYLNKPGCYIVGSHAVDGAGVSRQASAIFVLLDRA